MTMDFKTLPATGHFTLRDVTVPACLLGREGDLLRADIGIDDGKIAAPGGEDVQMAGAMVLPCFTDMHTHLDKGQIWPRASNPDGTFDGALSTVREDHANWTTEDVMARMEFGIRSAYAHGTRAIRTHMDSMGGQYLRSLPAMTALRDKWAGRVELQFSSLMTVDAYDRDEDLGAIADAVAGAGGTFGLVTFPMEGIRDRLDAYFTMAAERGLSADLHVDETMVADVETLRDVAQSVIDTGFDRPVVVGHCCSLSTQDEARAMDTLDLVARAGLQVVSLPMCNLYLQDRHPGRTPRGRGVTLVHEMKARGIPVSFASDNTRDPFYAYGDLDMLEVLRQATRIAHLDHSETDWVRSVTTTPAQTCGFDIPSLEAGAPADLVICKARGWTELYARPQSERIVLRGGRAIDRTLPDYSELDDLMRTP